MYFAGIDSNIMSLTGIAIDIGEVSDMSITFGTENIFRNLRNKRALKAVRRSSLMHRKKPMILYSWSLNNHLYVLPGTWTYRTGREALYTTSLDKDHCYWVISCYGTHLGSCLLCILS